MKKTCTKCKIDKDFSEFYKLKKSKDGLQYKCKQCTNDYDAEHKEERKSYIKEYSNSEKGKKVIEGYYKNYSGTERCRETNRKSSKKYRETDRGKEVRKKYFKTENGRTLRREKTKKWRKNNPLKNKAHWTVANAIVRGELTKPKICSICKIIDNRLHAHHENYNRPLEVIFCCHDCHDILDEQRRQREKLEKSFTF